MKRIVIGASAAVLMMGIAAPASACQGPQFESVVYPVMDTRPTVEEGTRSKVYKIRYSGERSGEANKLWPNFYVVDVLEGKMKGRKLQIPAHVTSCHSVSIAEGAEGYVIGELQLGDGHGRRLSNPILNTGMSGKVRKALEL